MKRFLFIALHCIASSAAAEALTENSEQKECRVATFEQFRADLEKFTIEPGWVVLSWISLPLDEFDKAWELFIETLRFNPWKFFVGKEKAYSERKYREQWIAHCKHYHGFLQNLLVDVTNKRLIFASGSEKTQYLKQPGLVTIFQYWQAKKITMHHHFYAFYFDRVAAQLYETVTNASLHYDTPDYALDFKKAKAYKAQLNEIFRWLQGGDYDGDYAYHLKRYREVLDLLQQERKGEEGGIYADVVP